MEVFMFRRHPRFQVAPLSANQLAVLVKANQLMADGKSSEAGRFFADVAADMQRSNHPRRAANLYTRAAHAFIDANNEQAAQDNARKALTLFIEFNMVGRAQIFFTNITRKMNDKGMKVAAESFQRDYGAQIPALPPELRQYRSKRGLLPTNCPKCGTAVHGDEVEWVDNDTVECEYCGTLIRIEGRPAS
jgi:DNA-directed RNA polymerase subunit RPC12/RpoP